MPHAVAHNPAELVRKGVAPCRPRFLFMLRQQNLQGFFAVPIQSARKFMRSRPQCGNRPPHRPNPGIASVLTARIRQAHFPVAVALPPNGLSFAFLPGAKRALRRPHFPPHLRPAAQNAHRRRQSLGPPLCLPCPTSFAIAGVISLFGVLSFVRPACGPAFVRAVGAKTIRAARPFPPRPAPKTKPRCKPRLLRFRVAHRFCVFPARLNSSVITHQGEKTNNQQASARARSGGKKPK